MILVKKGAILWNKKERKRKKCVIIGEKGILRKAYKKKEMKHLEDTLNNIWPNFVNIIKSLLK